MTEQVGIIAAALIGSLSGILALFLGRRRLQVEISKLQAESDSVHADEAEKLTHIAMGLLEPLQARIAELERLSQQQSEAIKDLSAKLEKSGKIIGALLRGISVLINQLVQSGLTPDFVLQYENGPEGIQELWERFDEA